MKILKRTLLYFIWTVVAMLTAFVYVRLLLGQVPDEESFGGFWFIAQVFYGYGVLYVGLAIGSIIALLFILMDIFYLKKKLKTNPRRTVIRFLVMVVITLVVALIHYMLEKVIDII